MVRAEELAQVRARQVVVAGAFGVVEVEGVDAQLVRHRDVVVLRDATRDPVVPADGLQPPDVLLVAEGDPVHLVGAVLGQQRAQALDALAGGADVGQDQGHKVLLAEPAGRARGRVVLHERVGAEHPRVAGDRLRGAHGDDRRVDAGARPDPVDPQRIRDRGVAQRILRDYNVMARNTLASQRRTESFEIPSWRATAVTAANWEWYSCWCSRTSHTVVSMRRSNMGLAGQ